MHLVGFIIGKPLFQCSKLPCHFY